MADLRDQALDRREPTSKAGLAAVVFIWLVATALSIWFLGLTERG